MNGSISDIPLPEAEALRCAQSAWRYKIEGKIIPSSCEPWARVNKSDILDYADELGAFWLLCRLRATHRPGEKFAVSPKPMALQKPFSKAASVRAARGVLLARGDLIQVHRGGRGAGDPSLYTLVQKEK